MSRTTSFRSRLSRRSLLLFCLVVVLGGLIGRHYVAGPAYGARLQSRSLQLGNNQPGERADYNLSFNLATPGTLGSVTVQFCSNDPLPFTPCTAPAGFDASQAVLEDQTGPGGFNITSASSTSNLIVLSRATTSASLGNVSFHFSNVMNPSSAGAYYVRLRTYNTTDASGTSNDFGGIAFGIDNSFLVSAEVPPYLIFCTGVTIANYNCANASGDYIDFGELSAQKTGKGTSQLLAASNAAEGYMVSISGTTLSSGNNAINALATGDVSRPGVAQFGMNLRANTTPGGGQNPSGPGTTIPLTPYYQPNVYRFAPGDTIIANNAPDDVRQYTASYIANVPTLQAPGIYVSTITYICLANF